ncbi:MAG: hypothetical protein ABFD92_09400 [Planctomycetaceae bacterium]|nr:hypothetical protein [Planctomycetaceae bacterium]
MVSSNPPRPDATPPAPSLGTVTQPGITYRRGAPPRDTTFVPGGRVLSAPPSSVTLPNLPAVNPVAQPGITYRRSAPPVYPRGVLVAPLPPTVTTPISPGTAAALQPGVASLGPLRDLLGQPFAPVAGPASPPAGAQISPGQEATPQTPTPTELAPRSPLTGTQPGVPGPPDTRSPLTGTEPGVPVTGGNGAVLTGTLPGVPVAGDVSGRATGTATTQPSVSPSPTEVAPERFERPAAPAPEGFADVPADSDE